MNASFKIAGIAEMLNTIDALADDLKAGARHIEKAAKSMATHSKRTGRLVESIGLSVRKNKGGPYRGKYTARVGARSGFATIVMEGGKPKRIDPVKYAHLVEFGTSKTPAQPFIRPAIESTKSTVMGTMATALDKHIARALKRKAKKNGLPS
jgi:HK97 gp10 family phage protein